MQMSKIEKWMLIVLSAFLFIALVLVAGAPIFSDEFLYIDTGLRDAPLPNYGNRYFHIYLQKFFVSVFPTPLTGIRVFWSFLIATTTALIYINARTFTKKSTVFHGLLAVVVFFSYKLVREYSGEPAVDITAMMMTTIYLTVYLWAVHHPKRERKALFVLGALAFLSFKTKETTIFINVLLLGFLVEQLKSKKRFRELFHFYTPFLLGAAAGIGLFIILDSVFLGKPFYAISPDTFAAMFGNYDYAATFLDSPVNWYRVYLLDDIMLPFLLFLISGFQLQNKLDEKTRIVWVYPLIFIAFISWNMIKVPWGFIERFFFPALPTLAVLGVQAIRFKFPKKTKGWIGFGVSLVISAAIAFLMRSLWMGVAQKYSADYYRLLEAIYQPILLSILLAVMLWEKRTGWQWTIVQVFCIASLLFTPLANNYKYTVTYPKVQDRFDKIFYPLNVFQNQLEIGENDRIYISTDIKYGLDMLSDDPNDISGMVNFYFDERISPENVFIGYERKRLGSDLVEKNLSHALLSANDIEQLKTSALWDSITEKFGHLYRDERETVYLLIR